MKKTVVLIISLFWFSTLNGAADIYRLFPGAQAAGSGYSMLTNSFSDVFHNAALESRSKKKRSVSLTYFNYILGIKQSSLWFSTKTKKLRIMTGLLMNIYGTFTGFEENAVIPDEPGARKDFKSNGVLGIFNLSLNLNSSSVFGISLLPAFNTLADQTGYGLAINMGYRQHISDFMWGAAINSLGPKYKIGADYSMLPLNFRLDFSYQKSLFNMPFKIGSAVTAPYKMPVYGALGVEAAIAKSFVYRLGWQINRYRNVSGFFSGFGTGATFYIKNITIDYAYNILGTLSGNNFFQGTNRLDLTFSF